MRPAIFFDRDGTLCRESGYINHPDRLELMPQTPGVLREVLARGWSPVVVTNQAGVARGYFPAHVLEQTHHRFERLLAAEQTRVDGIYACPHHPELGGPGYQRDCDCRKPKPGLLLRAAAELELDLPASFIVGDSFRDIGAGRAAGVRGTVLLRTGYGRGELLWKGTSSPVWPDYVADDLEQALAWIIRQSEEVI